MAGLPTLPGVRRRILDFDLENRPLAYRGFDRTTSEITVIAACFVGEPETARSWALPFHTHRQMLAEFLTMYEAADMVTGHYIIGHDLPMLNKQLVEVGMPPLPPKLAEDTYTQLIRTKDMPKSQKDLAEMMGIEAEKVGMSQAQWARANRLTPQGVAEAVIRAEGDVRQHMQLRVALRKAGLLRAPRVWRP